jgi:multidrug resistance efflux pump
MVSLVLLRWRELVWLIVNGPSLAEFFRVLSGKTASILEARAECRTARREFKEAQANLKAANAAMNEAARAARVADYAEDWPFERISPVKVRRVSWQEVAAKMNPADETTKAFIAAAKALDKAESEAHKATREYERTLARL